MMKVIELKGIRKTYRLGQLDVPVLHGIDISIEQGEFVAIMGHSGSGKSTLLNILGLLDKPSQGSYNLSGIEISKYSDNELATLRNHYLGFVFQQFNLLPKLTILENVALPSMYSGIKDAEHQEDPVRLLEMVGLSDRITHRPSEISGGQQQRVAIARALINKPLVIFADEPTGNLDTNSTKEIIKILKDLNASGITIVMVTHEPELASYATRVIKIQDGLMLSDERNESEQVGLSKHHSRQFKRKPFSLAGVKDYCTQAFSSLAGNKMRSILSVLGVMIGVASLIAMLAVGTGAKKYVEDQLSSLGSNMLYVASNISQKPDGTYSYKAGARVRMQEDDINDLQANVVGVKDVAGWVSDSYRYGAQVFAKGENCHTHVEGVSQSFMKMKDLYPTLGRFFTGEEDAASAKVVLLGEVVVKKIFGDKNFDPIGEYIKIGPVGGFQVIGVLSPKGQGCYGYNDDDRVIVPLNTAMRRLFGLKEMDHLEVQVDDNVNMEEVGENIKTRLMLTHRLPSSDKESILIINMAQIRAKMEKTSMAFSFLLGSVAFISLLVGGIGIMNIMFVSVSERTKEIGLRKAIGANNADILFQFIIESVFVCCAGGIIGIIFGVGTPFVIGKLTEWNAIITPFSIILAFVFSVFIGIVFGVLPARKASLLNPIDALRHD